MLQLISAFFDWCASVSGANYVTACFSLAALLGVDGRVLAGVAVLFYVCLAVR